MDATQIPGQWVIRRYGDPADATPYVGPGPHDVIFDLVNSWNRHVEHLLAMQRNSVETPFYMERVKDETPSVVARRICPPRDRQGAQQHQAARKPGRFNSVARRLHNLRQVAARVNGGVVTVAQYLTELGADAETIRRYAGTLGKHVKAAFIAKTGAEPVRSGLALVGHHLARVFAYDRADVEILRAATAGYARTSHLIGA